MEENLGIDVRLTNDLKVKVFLQGTTGTTFDKQLRLSSASNWCGVNSCVQTDGSTQQRDRQEQLAAVRVAFLHLQECPGRPHQHCSRIRESSLLSNCCTTIIGYLGAIFVYRHSAPVKLIIFLCSRDKAHQIEIC